MGLEPEENERIRAFLQRVLGEVGAIVLTLRQRPGVRKQVIRNQLDRRREDAVELKKVQPGQGI